MYSGCLILKLTVSFCLQDRERESQKEKERSKQRENERKERKDKARDEERQRERDKKEEKERKEREERKMSSEEKPKTIPKPKSAFTSLFGPPIKKHEFKKEEKDREAEKKADKKSPKVADKIPSPSDKGKTPSSVVGAERPKSGSGGEVRETSHQRSGSKSSSSASRYVRTHICGANPVLSSLSLADLDPGCLKNCRIFFFHHELA
jgi:hypothetical protein